MKLADFKKNNSPRETTAQTFQKDIKSLKKDIDSLIKDLYSTKQITEFLAYNEITASKLNINTYLAKRAKDLKVDRKPEQLKAKKV